jgi:hypothetical protein
MIRVNSQLILQLKYITLCHEFLDNMALTNFGKSDDAAWKTDQANEHFSGPRQLPSSQPSRRRGMSLRAFFLAQKQE